MNETLTKRRHHHPTSYYVITVVSVTILVIAWIIIMLPLLWGVLNSVKTNNEFYRNCFGWPEKILWSNYSEAWKAGISDYIVNSFKVTGISTFITVAISSLAAYGLARYRFKGGKVMFLMILGGLMVSEYCIIVPLYNVFLKLGLRNTHTALYIVYVTMHTPFSVFLIRSYFLSMPREVEEAAIIDGCSPLGIFFRIALPLSKPILFSAALITAVACWNEFMFAMVFIDSQNLMTIPLGLQTFQGQYRTNWSITLSACVISSLPLLIAFLVAQKQFVRGLAAGSVKG